MTNEPETRPRAGLFDDDSNLRVVLLCATLAVFAVQLDFFSVQASIPAIANDLDTTSSDLQWVISGYMLCTATFLIVAGRLADVFGRRNALVFGAVVFGIGSLLAGAATGPEMLIAMRVVMGFGAAFMFPVSLAIVTNSFGEANVQRAVGLVFGVGAVSQAIGPVLGGALTDLASWRWVLWVNVPIAFGVIVLAIARVPNSRDESASRSLDWLGLVLIIASIVSFTYGVDRSSDWGWTSAATLGLIVGGVVGLVAFVFVELEVTNPLLDLQLFANRVFSVMTAGGSVGNAGAVIVIFYSMVYLQDAEDLSPMAAGFAFLPFSIGYSIAAILSGRLERIEPWVVMSTALVVGGAATMAMGFVDPIPWYLALAFFSGLGLGITWSYTSVVTQSVVAPNLAGVASGTVLTVLISIGGVGLAVATTVYGTHTSAGAPNEADVINNMLVVTGALALVTAPVVAWLGRQRRHEADRSARVTRSAGR